MPACWQLKLPRGPARLELEAAGTPTQPPTGMLRLLVAYLRGRELVPVARLRTRREVRVVEGAEVVEDTVSVMEGMTVVRRFRELEVELLDGDEATLARMREILMAAGAVSAVAVPKLFRALELVAPAAGAAPLGAGTPPADALGIALEQEYLRLLAHDPGARRGDDPEDLHQLRVAVRRLRAYLRAARPLLAAEWADALRAELRWLGSVLGPARDLDVMLERLRDDMSALGSDQAELAGLLSGLEAERAFAYSSVVAALESDRYLALVERLEGAASPPLSGVSAPLATAWLGELRRLRRTRERLGRDPSDDDLHAARIAVKRARYAAELAAHELGRPGARFVAAARDVQDILGDHQDACVYEERVRQWLALDRGGAFAAGRLVERARGRRARSRRSWPACVAEARAPGAPGRPLSTVVHAAGGIVRRLQGGVVEVLLVHRPAYGDWTFPKGKLEAGESHVECALREVEEETGLRCAVGRELPVVSYRDSRGRDKSVRYWLMEVVGGGLRFEHEVDQARWVGVAEAATLLSYPRDLRVAGTRPFGLRRDDARRRRALGAGYPGCTRGSSR